MPRLFAPLLTLALVLLATAAGLHAEDAAKDLRKRPQPLKGTEHGVGALVPNLAFTDTDRRPGHLADFASSKALVIAYTNTSCPLCKRYGPRLGRMAKAWAAKGVSFLFVNPTPGEDPKVVAAARKAHGLTARYVVDEGRHFSRALRATTTAEVFVLDPTRTLVYRGAIDDQYGLGWALEAPTQPYLERALEAVLANHPPRVAATTAPGCLLGSMDETPQKAPQPTSVTWHAVVQRIVQNRCQSCHRPGENGPFSLLTYADAKNNAPMLAYVVKEKLMPPWFAAAESLPMRNDHSLTLDERGAIAAWVAADCPKGDPADAPRPRTWTQGWKIGTPDAIVELARPVHVPAEGTVRYQYQTVPTDFGEDKWVSAFEVRPSAPQVVHHVLVFARYPKDHPRRAEQPNNRHGVDGYFVAMVPGQTAYRFPEGIGRFIPRGTRLRFQIHYTTNGTPATDRTRVGLIFTKGKPKREMRTSGLANVGITIPAGAANHRAGTTRRLPVAARLHGFTPHMHVRGKAFRYEALLPDGTKKLLLDIPRYDFNWQLSYQLAEPLDVPAGTRLIATAWYDNSKDNPANPDPTKVVRWGDQTWQEMLIGYVDWHPLVEGK